MEIELLNAILIAEKYTGQDSIEDKIKKLGEEVAEFTIAALTSENPDTYFSCCGNQERKGHKPWCRKK